MKYFISVTIYIVVQKNIIRSISLPFLNNFNNILLFRVLSSKNWLNNPTFYQINISIQNSFQIAKQCGTLKQTKACYIFQVSPRRRFFLKKNIFSISRIPCFRC